MKVGKMPASWLSVCLSYKTRTSVLKIRGVRGVRMAGEVEVEAEHDCDECHSQRWQTAGTPWGRWGRPWRAAAWAPPWWPNMPSLSPPTPPCPDRDSTWWMFNRSSWLGIERYAVEHWIGSHPDLKPCDVFSAIDGVPTIEYSVKGTSLFADDITPILRLAPGADFKTSYKKKYKLHPWYRAGGRLYEYKALYSKVPEKSSWFYDYWKDVPINK